MKTTSVFGGVQVFNIFINIVRSKFVAVLLGPAGMGIMGMLQATSGMVAALTNFGLGTSAVKDISAAHASGDSIRISTVVTVFRRLVWITGLLGALLTLVFSPLLSQITFGNKEYTWAFVWISLTLLLNQVSTGQGVLLRATRRIKAMAQSSMIGSLMGLITSVPLYYFFGLKGIVPGIIISAISSLFLTWYFARRIKIQPVYVSKANTIAEGKGMLKMGFMISLSGMITLGSSYILRIFITRVGGVDQVGFYAAGFAIVESYVGMIFTAMSTDYFPRLSAVNKDNRKIRQIVTQQSEVAILILVPVIVAFIVFSPYIIKLLYSIRFLPIVLMINLAVIGMAFRSASWAMGFILYAKGDSSIFIKTAIGFSVIFLLNNICGYYLLGLTGLGLSFLINYIIHFAVLLLLTNNLYQFKFEKGFYKLFFMGLLLCFLSFSATLIPIPTYRYFAFLILIIFSLFYSFRSLHRRLDLKLIINNLRNKIKK